MKKNTSWKFTDEASVTFQLSISGPGEFSLKVLTADSLKKTFQSYVMLIICTLDVIFCDVTMTFGLARPLN